MTTVVIKDIYPADIHYTDTLARFFPGDSGMADSTTNMRNTLDNELNESDAAASWDRDVVQDIFYRQGKLHIACQSEHVQTLTGRITKFFEAMIVQCSEADLATVCGIRDYNP